MKTAANSKTYFRTISSGNFLSIFYSSKMNAETARSHRDDKLPYFRRPYHVNTKLFSKTTAVTLHVIICSTPTQKKTHKNTRFFSNYTVRIEICSKTPIFSAGVMWLTTLIHSVLVAISRLHLGVGLQLVTNIADIETYYGTSLEKIGQDGKSIDWGCTLPTSTKVQACKELLSDNLFAFELNVRYNDWYESTGNEFSCESHDLMMTSTKYLGVQESRDLFMCPTCAAGASECIAKTGDDDDDVEEFYLSKAFGEQSMFVYTWFKLGKYFTFYAYAGGFKTPLKPQTAEIANAFTLWPTIIKTQPILGYEAADIDYDPDKKSPAKIIPKSTMEMVEVV